MIIERAYFQSNQPRSLSVKETGAGFSSLHGACQERGDLSAGAGGVGVETAAAHTGGNAVLDGPGHSLRIVAVSGNVSKAGAAARRRLTHGPPQHGDHLSAVDGGVGLRAVGNALILGPQLRLFVPSIAAVQICVVLPRQNRPKLGAGGGVVGGVAAHQDVCTMAFAPVFHDNLTNIFGKTRLPSSVSFRHIVFPVIHTRGHMSEVPRIDFALARNHLIAAHRTAILLPLLRIECVNAVMIRCQSIFQSDPSSQNNLIAVFLAARVSLEAILKKAHIQDFGCRILNSAAAMFPELFKLILMVKI